MRLETERLILRPYTMEDVDAVQIYASDPDVVRYMGWGPNTPEQTAGFVQFCIERMNQTPCIYYQFAAMLKDSGQLIGGCDLHVDGDTGGVGWILNRDYWRQGYGTEMGRALLAFGFDTLGLRRIVSRCDAENVGSYGIMERIGMRREGTMLCSRSCRDGQYADEHRYAMLRDEWDTQKEIAYYNASPCKCDGFITVPELRDGDVHLVCVDKKPGIPEKKWVPAYQFLICKGSERIGIIDLRIGYTDGLYYGGQIGYGVDEPHRGNGYAVSACRALVPVIKAHGMTRVLITNNHTNHASRRVCEKLGARLIRVARLPEWHDLYKEGDRFENIFEWTIDIE